jgi:asparagine synthase (glutamine-hydrolysing)
MDPNAKEVISRVRNENLTYLNTLALIDLFNTVSEIENNGIRGVFVEAGCALGGSALVIASAKKNKRKFFIFDTFSQIPPPTNEDGEDVQDRWEIISSGKAEGINGNQYYGYVENLKEWVENKFSEFGFSLQQDNIIMVRGYFQETLNLIQPVAFAHLDCDWYESVMICLQRIEPMMVPGGTFIIDDYEHWSGCKKAVDEFFADKKEGYYFKQLSKLHIIKK